MNSSKKELERLKEENDYVNNAAEEGRFIPTPGQVNAIRSFYKHMKTPNKKGVFGNAIVLGV